MSIINVWRIPILFLISGMGVRFAMERRGVIELLKDRTLRILVPLVFGFFFVCPITIALALRYYGKDMAYVPNAGHLWFLGNIYLYVLLLLPVFVHLKNRPDGWFLRGASRVFRNPLAPLLVAVPLMLEAWLVAPTEFVTYALTIHGFWLGLVCFATGFALVSIGDPFWFAAERGRYASLAVAVALFVGRTLSSELAELNPLLALESAAWMMALTGFSARHFNRPSAILAYASAAVYPVYILHLPVQNALAFGIMQLPVPAVVKLVALLIGTFGACLALHVLILKRAPWLRPLFGMKLELNR
jgi:hypothetical protein